MSNVRYLDLSGQKYERLTVLYRTDRRERAAGNVFWMCRCDCGKEVEVRGNSLRSGNSKSCGCLQSELASKRKFRHGLSEAPIKGVWHNIKIRCYDPDHETYKYYGGLGIKMCAGWKDDLGAFARDMGDRPPRMTVERIDVRLGYYCGKCAECVQNNWPFNCKWDTQANQNRNKRNSIKVNYRGEIKTMGEWCVILGKKNGAVWHRMKKMDMSFEDAVADDLDLHKRRVTAFGETKTLSEWCEEKDKDHDLVYSRIFRQHWDPEEALTLEVGATGNNQRKAARYLFRGEMMLLSEIAMALGKQTSYFYSMKRTDRSIQDLIDKLSAAQKASQ